MNFLDVMYLKFLQKIYNRDGIGTVEMILILVILVALVLLFKNKITEIVNTALNKVGTDSSSIIG